MTTNNPTLTADAAAKFLGLATSTLAKMRLNGNGPVYYKLGRRVVYRMEDLVAFLESRMVRNTSDADARLPKSLTGLLNLPGTYSVEDVARILDVPADRLRLCVEKGLVRIG